MTFMIWSIWLWNLPQLIQQTSLDLEAILKLGSVPSANTHKMIQLIRTLPKWSSIKTETGQQTTKETKQSNIGVKSKSKRAKRLF